MYKNLTGSLVESVTAQIEKHLATFGYTREPHHGGDFNGVPIRALVGNIDEIMPGVHEIVIREKDLSYTDKEALKTLDTFLSICGLIDAAFLALLVTSPTE
jgi:hypothetical protein